MQRIDDIIAKLEKLKEKYGNIRVVSYVPGNDEYNEVNINIEDAVVEIQKNKVIAYVYEPEEDVGKNSEVVVNINAK